MTVKLAAFLITMITTLAAGVVILFFMLLAMNGYSESDATWGLGAYVLMALIVVVLSSTGASFLADFLTRKHFSPFVSALTAIAVFWIIGIGLQIVCSLIGIGVAELVRVKF